MLGEFDRRRLQNLAQHARLEFHQHAVDTGACPLPVIQRHRVVAEFDADLRQDTVRRVLDADEVFFGHDVVGRNSAHDIRPAKPLGTVRALIATRHAPAPFAASDGMGDGFGHVGDHIAAPETGNHEAIRCSRHCDA